ncbi:MAG: tRNA (adenosine(37)-N6)-threonylcarbamoyltransferase complex ATPase subunit type 1 TsaE [Clostridia bacterium]|nr:tRNA (adenosine(37)-N6)-threonylcarbamoyltransferase complex ATPase subunit type 1 TsaE [Clostridia bacterium]
MEFTLNNVTEQQLEDIAASIAQKLFPGAFIALFGDLGAGKTAFTRYAAKALGIDDIQSPTFTIVREHDGSLPLFHFDCYRLEDEEELYAIGFDDYLERGGAIIMEWCERVPYALPAERLELHIEGSGAMPRTLRFVPVGEQYHTLLENIKC